MVLGILVFWMGNTAKCRATVMPSGGKWRKEGRFRVGDKKRV